MSRVAAIIGKEWAETIRNRLLLATTCTLPVIFLILPLVTLYGVQTQPVDSRDVARYVELAPQYASLSGTEIMQIVMLNQFLLFFLLMPSIIPMTIAAYSIIGEKQSRTLEPLLATPATTGEILLGKVVAAVTPAVVLTWLSYGLFLVASYFIVSPIVWLAAANQMWLLAMLAIGPLTAVFSVFLGVIISSRVNDTRVAQQIGGFLVLPIAGFAVAQTAGFVLFNLSGFAIAAAVLAIADVLAYLLAERIFQRDRILTKWR
jgi:ABC-2 type transport system permease protein